MQTLELKNTNWWPLTPVTRLMQIVGIVGVVSLMVSGCSVLHLRKEVETINESSILVGMVACATSPVNGPIVVAAYTKEGIKRDIANYTVLHEPGPYELIVPKGAYYIVAFVDANQDLALQSDELAGQYSEQAFRVDRTGGVITDLNIVVNEQGKSKVDLPPGMAMTQSRPEKIHFTSPGVVAPLHDPLFSEENGVKGYWQPYEFFKEFGGNIYFLEKYDPAKIPILFVHGATGTPEGWEYLLAHIDLNRFQPWFYYYPSGASIKSMADLLFWKFLNLQTKYQFKEAYVVAHSMGGLVVRSFLVDYGQLFPSITKFVSISTPWSGDNLSEYGVKYSPGVIPAWKDMGPQSEFAQSIYRKTLPPAIEYYLFFGHRGNRNPLRPNNDGVITLATQLDPRAQAEAKMVCGFDEDHSSILTSKPVATLFNTVISASRQINDSAVPAGMLRVRFSYAVSPGQGNSWPELYLQPVDQSTSGTIFLNLSAVDNGRSFGPFPAGDYQVSLLADAFRAKPVQHMVTIGTQGTAAVAFELIPAGNVSGTIKRKFYNDGDPAGIYMPLIEDVTVRSIRLTGKKGDRVVIPVRDEKFNAFASYQAGKDWAYKTTFAFYNVPEGDYLLTIETDGYESYTEQRIVVPGQSNRGKAIELTPLK
jgi:pimeloyl-ACP methyl ester carboxylesterase